MISCKKYLTTFIVLFACLKESEFEHQYTVINALVFCLLLNVIKRISFGYSGYYRYFHVLKLKNNS